LINKDDPRQFYPKAYDNLRFMHSSHARTLRLLAEYLEPQSRLRMQNIVFFGSARSIGSDELEEQRRLLTEELNKREDLTRRQIERRLRNQRQLSKYYDEAVELSSMLTEYYRRMPDPRDRHCICSGAGPGMMEAANRGAHQAGGKTIGLSISLPFEQGINHYLGPEETFEFHYFFMRKYWFIYLARALVVFPGGFGTMDEMFEVLTLLQTRKISRNLPIVLYGSEFWEQIVSFDKLVEWGVIHEEDLNLFHVCDTPEDAFVFLTSAIEQVGQYPDK
jgi:uncharacterized protein (TIGR00730 family)